MEIVKVYRSGPNSKVVTLPAAWLWFCRNLGLDVDDELELEVQMESGAPRLILQPKSRTKS